MDQYENTKAYGHKSSEKDKSENKNYSHSVTENGVEVFHQTQDIDGTEKSAPQGNCRGKDKKIHKKDSDNGEDSSAVLGSIGQSEAKARRSSHRSLKTLGDSGNEDCCPSLIDGVGQSVGTEAHGSGPKSLIKEDSGKGDSLGVETTPSLDLNSLLQGRTHSSPQVSRHVLERMTDELIRAWKIVQERDEQIKQLTGYCESRDAYVRRLEEEKQQHDNERDAYVRRLEEEKQQHDKEVSQQRTKIEELTETLRKEEFVREKKQREAEEKKKPSESEFGFHRRSSASGDSIRVSRRPEGRDNPIDLPSYQGDHGNEDTSLKQTYPTRSLLVAQRNAFDITSFDEGDDGNDNTQPKQHLTAIEVFTQGSFDCSSDDEDETCLKTTQIELCEDPETSGLSTSVTDYRQLLRNDFSENVEGRINEQGEESENILAYSQPAYNSHTNNSDYRQDEDS